MALSALLNGLTIKITSSRFRFIFPVLSLALAKFCMWNVSISANKFFDSLALSVFNEMTKIWV